jgi:hypothetical protein
MVKRAGVLLERREFRCHVNWTPKTGRAKTGRRNLDGRQLDARDNWTHATIGRVRQLDGGRMRQYLK